MKLHRITPLRVRVQKLDRSFYSFAEHEPEVIFRGRTVFDAIGQCLLRYRDLIALHGLGAIEWINESGREFNAVPLPACCWRTERFRQEFRLHQRKAA